MSAEPRPTNDQLRENAVAADVFTKDEIDALTSIDDLLSDDEKRKLNADLAEMARLRRRALNASANWQMP